MTRFQKIRLAFMLWKGSTFQDIDTCYYYNCSFDELCKARVTGDYSKIGKV